MKTFLKIFLTILITLTVAFGSLFAVMYFQNDKSFEKTWDKLSNVFSEKEEDKNISDKDNSSEDKEDLDGKYSDQQLKIIKEIGLPDTFTIVHSPETNGRVEIWTYLIGKKTFMFKNGNVQNIIDEKEDAPQKSVMLTPKLMPIDGYRLKTVRELENLLEIKPTVTGDFKDDLVENAKYYNYDNTIIAGELDGKLIYLKTQATFVPEPVMEKPKEDNIKEEKSQEDILYESDIYSFSLTLPSSWKGYKTEITKDEENGVDYISFWLPTIDTNYGEFVNLFTISAYKFGGPNNIPELEIYIGQTDLFSFGYSHLNGDPPKDLEDRVLELSEIEKSFKVDETSKG